MGKATILTDEGSGQYTVTLNLSHANVIQMVADLNAQIAILTTRIATLPAGAEKNLVTLKRTALQKQVSWLETYDIDDPTPITIWCADITTGLSGEVGTIEVPGERGTTLIQPGYGGNAVYSGSRDGQLSRAVNMEAPALFYNLAMMPGWQKWMPTYRFGTISNLDGNICDITLTAATSSQQLLDVNQSTSLTNVPIEYMACNGAAFTNGDEAVIEFVGQDFANPKVVGFVSAPEICPISFGSAHFTGGHLTSADSADWFTGTDRWLLSFYVKFSDVEKSQGLFMQKEGNWPLPSWGLNYKLRTGPFGGTIKELELYYENGGQNRAWGAWSPIVDTWYRITVRRRTGGLMQVLVGATIIIAPGNPATSADANAPLTIGNEDSRGAVGVFDFLDGYIAEFELWNIDTSTKLLELQFEGVTGSTTFTDGTGRHIVTNDGAVAIDSTESPFN